MNNESNLGDVVESLLALDHRERYHLRGWVPHEGVGDFVAMLCLALERFRFVTRTHGFSADIWCWADLEPYYLQAIADDEAIGSSKARRLKKLKARPKVQRA